MLEPDPIAYPSLYHVTPEPVDVRVIAAPSHNSVEPLAVISGAAGVGSGGELIVKAELTQPE